MNAPMVALIRQLADAVCDDLEAEAAANTLIQPSEPVDVPDARSKPCTDCGLAAHAPTHKETHK